MVKTLLGYGACALVILFLLYGWHEKDKEVNALETKLEAAHLVIAEKEKESKREQEATTERDEKFEKQDKLLSDIHRSLRKLQQDNAKIRDILSTVVPGESLHGLRSFSTDNKHQATGTGTSPAPSGNTEKPR